MLFQRASWLSSSLLGLLLAAAGVSSAVELKDHGHAQTLLDESMDFMDKIYDRDAGYLYYFYYPLAAGQHETRSSMWYATGLLQRNRGDDLDQAVRIIKNIIGDQEKNETLQWFGDYTVYPEQPTVGHGDYKPVVSLIILPFSSPESQVTYIHLPRSTTRGTPTGEASSAPTSSSSTRSLGTCCQGTSSS